MLSCLEARRADKGDLVVRQTEMRRGAAVRGEVARIVCARVIDARAQRDERAQAPRSADAEIAEDVVFAADRQVGTGIRGIERLAILDLIYVEAVPVQVQPVVLSDGASPPTPR